MENINVDKDVVDEYSEGVTSIAHGFEYDGITSFDWDSTITANMNGRIRFYTAQHVDTILGNNLEQEAKNIRSLGLAFTQYDEMLAELADIEGVRAADLKFFK